MGKVKEVATIIKNIDEQIQLLVAIKEDLESLFDTTTSEPQVTIPLEQVRAVLAEKSRDGFTKEVKTAIQSFGVIKLSEVKAEDYSALLEKAKEIGNE
ncbi:hypothetical protein NHG32_06275 [Aerococcaceae bacterium NML191219]|nr:hypothetical protein [Aerococcaceae bacterium NML191219]